MKLLIGTLLTVATVAQAAPQGRKVEQMLHSPGARVLMDEEVQSWRNKKTDEGENDAVMNAAVILHGTPSNAQYFNRGKLIRCDARLIGGGKFAAIRNSCDVDHPIYLPVSIPGKEAPVQVAAGSYVLGFENSIYPGFLQVKAGETKTVELQQIAVPAGGKVKVYRDMNSLNEEVKQYFTTYVLGESVFHEAEYPWGDLYIKAFGMRDGSVSLNYKTCEEAHPPKMTDKGSRICRAWNMGTFMTLTEMFNFSPNGSFLQWEVGDQGKPYPYPMGRLLVAAQTTSAEAAYVNVLPGQYVVELTPPTGAASAKPTGPVGDIPASNALSMNLGWLPQLSQLTMTSQSSLVVPAAIDPQADPNAPTAAAIAASDDGGGDGGAFVNTNVSCGAAHMWRTELRSYCTSDAAPGCQRSAARVCEPMFDIP